MSGERERFARVVRGLAKLAPTARELEIAYCYVIEDETGAEIAGRMGIATSSVSSAVDHLAMRCGLSGRELRRELLRAYWMEVGREFGERFGRESMEANE